MKTEDLFDVNDLDYLNDIIPYRCPKCRDERKFSSLSDLRGHLDKNHSFQIGYVRPHSRTKVFDAKSAKTKENNSINEGKRKTNSKLMKSVPSDGRSSPLLLSFKEDARILESQLQAAKEAEMRNKERSQRKEMGCEDTEKSLHHKSSRSRELGCMNEEDPVNSLHYKLMSSRSRQWKAEEALYNIDSVLESMERSVERRFQDQRGVISDLASSLGNREEQLSQANSTLKSLQRERQKLMKETQEMLQQSEIKNERLKLELERRDDVLLSVQSQLQDLRVKTEESVRQRDNELMLTKDRVHHLELEKETLMRDVEELMRASDQDNSLLKQSLGAKERQLKLVNNELLKIRLEQSDLMDESVKLYEAAEMGNEKLKKAIQAKDSKLQHAETELYKLRKMQDDLVNESHLLTEQADTHSQAMRKILTEKETLLSSLRQELEKVTQERDGLLQARGGAPVVGQVMQDVLQLGKVTAPDQVQGSVRAPIVGQVTPERDGLFQTGERAPFVVQVRQDMDGLQQRRMRAPVEEKVSRQEVPPQDTGRTSAIIQEVSNPGLYGSLDQKEPGVPQQIKPQIPGEVTPSQPMYDVEISQLQSVLEEKQAHLEEKERELETLKQFINTAAEKEMVGRQKLEEFISELIDRADRAERELNLSRSQVKISHPTQDLPQKISQRQGSSLVQSSEQLPTYSTSLYNSVAKHLVEATVEQWPSSLVTSTAGSKPNSENMSTGYNKIKAEEKKGPSKKTTDPHSKKSGPVKTPCSQDSTDARVTSPGSRFSKGYQKRKTESNRTLPSQFSSETEVMSTDNRTNMVHQQRNSGSLRRSMRYSSEESDDDSLDEDSTQYSPLPTTKYPKNKKQFQRTNSGQSYMSQKHGWMDPDSVLYSEVPNDEEDLERVSEDSFKRLPSELHQISGGNPNVVYVPFDRKTGHPIRSDPDQFRPGPDSDPKHQENLHGNLPVNPLEETVVGPEHDPTAASDKSSPSHSGFKEIQPRKSPKTEKGHSQFRGHPMVNKEPAELYPEGEHRIRQSPKTQSSSRHSGGCHLVRREGEPTQLHPYPEGEQKPQGEKNTVVMKSIGVMADIPSFQGTSTASETFEDMEMAENSLSDIKSFSDDYPVEKQDSFDREVDENGIIWDVDEDSNHLLMESRRFSPYGSEMKSPSDQGGAFLDESDSLDSIPVRDQCGEKVVCLSEGTEEGGLNSLSCHSYPFRRKRVNFQTPSGYSDPVSYRAYKKSRSIPESVGYDLLKDDTDEDDYEEDIKRWKHFTEEINTDLQKEKVTPHKLQKDLRGGKFNCPALSSVGYSDKSQLSHRSVPTTAGQGYSWHRKSHPVDPQSFMLPFAEPPQRTMSSPGLYKRYMRNEDVSYFPHNFSSSWRSSIQRGRYIRDVNQRLCSSLSNINMRAQTEHQQRASICKDSSTQTWLLDRQLTEKDLPYMKEISSSVSSFVKDSARKSQPSDAAAHKFQQSGLEIVSCKSCSNNSSHPSNKSPSSSVIARSYKSLDENQSVSLKDTKSVCKVGVSQNTSSSSDVPLHKLFQESSEPDDNTSKMFNSDESTNKKRTVSLTPDDIQNTEKSSTSEELIFSKSTANSESSTSKVNNYSDNSEKTPDAGTKVSSTHSASLSDLASKKTSLKNTKSGNSDMTSTASKSYAENSRQQSGNSNEVGQQVVANQNCDEVIQDSNSITSNSKSDSDLKSGRNYRKSLGQEDVPNTHCNELSENSEDTSKISEAKKELSNCDENKSLEVKDNVSLDVLDTNSNPSKKISHKSSHSVHTNEEGDTSVMTELSLDSNVADISYQSSNFSDFFKESTAEMKMEERMEDPDKDRNCLEEMEEEMERSHTKEPASDEINEGRQDRNNVARLKKQKTLSPEAADFEPFSMEFEGGTRAAVFSEVQETEDEDDVSTLDSCSVTLSNSEGSHVFTSRREETRRRRQALLSVFLHLDVDSLLIVAQVCREWKKVSRNKALWKQVILENKKCSSKFLISLSNCCMSMKHLTLKNLKPRDQRKTEADDVYKTSIRGSLEPGLERLLQVSESSLKTLSIISCGTLLTDKSIWLASCYSRMLCSVEYLSSAFLLGPDVMYALGAGCRDITTLKIQPIYPCENEEKFTNKCLQIVSQFCCNLEVLSIGGSKVDINGLVLIAKSCPRLQQLELHHCQEISADTAVAISRVGLKQLLSLAFIHTAITEDALKHLNNSCKHLKSIHVALSITDFHQGKAEKEETKLKKWQKFVKDMKSLEKIPGLGNILKLNLQQT